MSAGVLGVVASAALFAVFCVAVWMRIVERLGVLGVIFIGTPFLTNIANSESGFALAVGGGIHAIVIYGLLYLAIRFLMPLDGLRRVQSS